MRQNVMKNTDSASAIARYFSNASTPTQQETLGEILRAGNNLNRKSICARLLRRLEAAASPEEESHYQTLIGMLFER